MSKKKIILLMLSFVITMVNGINSLIAMEEILKEDIYINKKYKSENFKSREDKKIEILVLHCVGLPDEWVFQNYTLPSDNGGLGVSAHYYVSQTSDIFELVPQKECAFHAGISEWRDLAFKNNVKGLNAISVGIEFQSLGYAQLSNKEGYFPYHFTPFQKKQEKCGISLSKKIMGRNSIKRENVVWHSDVSPSRKTDPGRWFPAEDFAEKGIGVWPSSDRYGEYQLDTSLKAIQAQLQSWGYPNVKPNDVFDEGTKFALQSHYIHYLPHTVNWESYKEKTGGSIFDDINSWLEFPYDKDSLCISLYNLNNGHYKY